MSLTCEVEAYSRVFLQIGNLSIYWYGVIIAAGLFLGLYLAQREANRLGLQKDVIVDLIVFAAPIAIIFARIYYVIFEWDSYAGRPFIELFAIWEGGIAIHGALIGAVLTTIVYTRVKASILANRRYCSTKSDFRTSNRTLGKFHEPGGTWWANFRGCL